MEKFPDEQSCIEYLENRRWPEGNVISPFDPSSKVYTYGHKFMCKNTHKYFNVKTATLFDNTKVSLRKWFLAIYLAASQKKGISSVQLGKEIGVTQKTAWFMLQRIRKCFGIKKKHQLSGIVEADETFVGGKNKNRHADKKVQYSQGRSFKDKTPILGLLKRGSKHEDKEVRLFVLSSTSKHHVQPHIGEHVEKGSTFYSDEWWAYRGLNSRYNHKFIDHSKKQYVDGDVHTNTIEGCWSILKRSILGIYHKVTRKHLQLYCNEFEFRYNYRNLDIGVVMDLFFGNREHRLTYKELTA